MTTSQIYAIVNAAVVVAIVWAFAALLMRSNRRYAKQTAEAAAERMAGDAEASRLHETRHVVPNRDHSLAK